MGKKKQEPVDPNNLKPEDVLKFEIAAELGPVSYTHLDGCVREQTGTTWTRKAAGWPLDL